jgi:hypothetical protein
MDVLRDGDVMDAKASAKGGRILPPQRHGRLLVCGENVWIIVTAGHTSHTNMAAQAAIKAPFRLGTKEVHLYVCPVARAQS